MKRRSFLTGAAAIGATAAVSACGKQEECATGAGAGVSTKKRTLKMATTWPKNFPGLGTSAERVAKRIGELTDGQLEIKVYAAGELFGPFEAFDAASRGTVDMYHGGDYYFQGKSKALNFFTGVPFGLTAAEMNAWIYFGGGRQLWDEVTSKFNLKSFMATNTGTQMGGWFKKEINSLEDLKGLKMRMPGLGGEVMRRAGVAVVNLAGGDIFTSLQSGAIDAAEWVGPWNDLAFGFQSIANHYYYPGFHEPGSSITLGTNADVWASLTPFQQNAIENACQAEVGYSQAEFMVRNADALKTLKEKYKIIPKPFPDDVMAELGRLSTKVLEEIAAGDDLTNRIYQSFLKARSDQMAYGDVSDYAYINARRKALATKG